MPPSRICLLLIALCHLCLSGEPLWAGQLAPAAGSALDQLSAGFESEAVVVYCGDEPVYSAGAIAEKYNAASVRKSLVSALYGIAAARDLIDLDAPLAELGFDDPRHPLSAAEQRATVRDLLRARSGIYLPAHGESPSMRRRKPARGSREPGAHFYYNNWDFNALGLLFEAQTGLALGDAFARWIAGPIGMQDFTAEDVVWQPADEQVGLAMYRFFMSARDLARFGALYAGAGRWRGESVIPEAWVQETFTVRSEVPYGIWDGYGLLWWYKANSRSWWALGSGGQRVVVDPAAGIALATVNNTGQGPLGRWWYRHFGRAAPEWEAFAVLEVVSAPDACR